MAGVTLVTIACVIALFVTGKEKDRAFECKFHLTRLSQAMRAGNLGLAHEGWDDMPTGSRFWIAAPQWPGSDKRTFPITTQAAR